jgi:hypothetical protein
MLPSKPSRRGHPLAGKPVRDSDLGAVSQPDLRGSRRVPECMSTLTARRVQSRRASEVAAREDIMSLCNDSWVIPGEVASTRPYIGRCWPRFASFAGMP